MIEKLLKQTGRLFIFYIVFCYIYAYFITIYPYLGSNIYNFIKDYSDNVIKIMPMYIALITSFYIGWKISIKKIKTRKILDYKIKNKSSIGFFSSIILLLISTLLLYMVYGNGVLYRDTYHPKDANYIYLAIYKVLVLFSIILIYLSDKIKDINKFLFLFLFLFISLSIGSRITVIYLLLIFLMYLFTNTKIKFRIIFFYIINIVFLIIFIQYSRGLEENGLLGIIKYTNFNEMFLIFNLISYYISAFSIFVTAATYESYIDITNFNDFIIMLNPLPGALAGWYDINLNMIVMPVVPYSSIGTIFTLGYKGIIPFYLLLGMIVGYIDNTIAKNIYKKKYFLAILLWIFMVLFIIFHNQYTLRTSMRFIYYSLFIISITYLYSLLKKKFKKVNKNDFK